MEQNAERNVFLKLTYRLIMVLPFFWSYTLGELERYASVHIYPMFS
jgi:hypothetical protein